MNIEDILKKAIESLSSIPRSTTVRVVSHYDTDGATAAAILCKALYRRGYDFHATLLKHPFEQELSKINEENNDFIIFSDMGSGQIELIRKFDCPSIIIDHHQPIINEPIVDSTIQINANLVGFDGNYEASGSSVSYLFAKTLDKKNRDLSPLALTGAIGDKQHLGGFSGLNRIIFEEAIADGFIKVEKGKLKIGDKSLAEEISYSVDPYYTFLSGRERNVEKFLKEISIESNKRYNDLSIAERKKLHSALVLKLLENKLQPEIIDAVIKDRYISNDLPDDLDRFSDVIDACGKSGETGLALAISLGDREKYIQAKDVEQRHRKLLIEHLKVLEDGELKESKNIQYFYSPKASIGSVLSGIVMNYFPYKGKPTFSFSVKDDGTIHVSCRATRFLVSKGLDLGEVMRKVASKLDCKGGGHKIAAGGTIRGTNKEELISLIDEQIELQMGGA